MNILIVSATLAEVQPLVNALKIPVTKTENFYKTVYAGHTITLLITGVGMVATAYQLGGIHKEDFDIALNAGIAGSFSKELPIGQLVNVTSDCLAELGADYGNKFVPLVELDFANETSEKFINKKGEIQNNTTSGNSIINSLKKVKGITVNTINGEADRIEKIIKLFAPDVESMEGAAFLYSCLKKNLPCFQLRTISNYIEPRNLNNWDIPFAISYLNKHLLEIITAF
jgi:futalosine hydrolase